MTDNVLQERYEVVRTLGIGGMSNVYLVKDKKLECLWAMKRIGRKHNKAPEVMLEMYTKEVYLLKSLRHSGIPRIVDTFTDCHYLYVVMDYIEGVSLGDYVSAGHIVQVEEVISWMLQLCDIFIYLHSRQPYPILYLDLKPQNIMVTPLHQIKLIDFGACEYEDRKKRIRRIASPRLHCKGSEITW